MRPLFERAVFEDAMASSACFDMAEFRRRRPTETAASARISTITSTKIASLRNFMTASHLADVKLAGADTLIRHIQDKHHASSGRSNSALSRHLRPFLCTDLRL